MVGLIINRYSELPKALGIDPVPSVVRLRQRFDEQAPVLIQTVDACLVSLLSNPRGCPVN